jgi:hypothetical protein
VGRGKGVKGKGNGVKGLKGSVGETGVWGGWEGGYKSFGPWLEGTGEGRVGDVAQVMVEGEEEGSKVTGPGGVPGGGGGGVRAPRKTATGVNGSEREDDGAGRGGKAGEEAGGSEDGEGDVGSQGGEEGEEGEEGEGVSRCRKTKSQKNRKTLISQDLVGGEGGGGEGLGGSEGVGGGGVRSLFGEIAAAAGQGNAKAKKSEKLSIYDNIVMSSSKHTRALVFHIMLHM